MTRGSMGASSAFPRPRGLDDLADVVERLRDLDATVADVTLEHPTLDEVFTALTAPGVRDTPDAEGALSIR